MALTKKEKLIFGSIGIITLLAIILSFFFGGSAEQRNFNEKYEEAVSINDIEERSLAEGLTKCAEASGVQFRKAYITFDRRGNPSSFVYFLDGEFDKISIKNLDLKKPVSFIPEYWKFINP